ncbi:MAG: glycosyltransferase [Actinomycetota bacterium]|nr:glycosyltransferase [Actinomycetota bacterium]
MSSPGGESRGDTTAGASGGVLPVALVVPLYNEQDRLGAFVAAVEALVGGSLCPGLMLQEVVLVDDGSTDKTPALLAELAARADWTVVPACPGTHGKGNAIARGAAAASAPFLLLSDVDLAAPLSEASKLADALTAGAAIAIGSRDVAGSSVTAPLSRVITGRAFNALVRAVTGLPVKDTQCGFKLLPLDLARTLLSSLLVSGLAFDVELLLRARAGGHRVAEVPIRYHHGELSTVRPVFDAGRMAKDVVRLAIRMRLRPFLSRSRRDAGANG